MRFTVLGAGGYIGSHLVARLRADGYDVLTPQRDAPLPREPGHVINAIGVASDFRSRPFDTVRAHVAVLERYLRDETWESFLFLSSTRVYAEAASGDEDAALVVRPELPDHLYNITKIAGESLCLTLPNPKLRVVRLANVYGDDAGTETFIADVLEAARAGAVVFRTARASEKDYVALQDVLDVLPRIAVSGQSRLYNVASGRNVSAGALADALQRYGSCRCTFAEDASTVRFPPIEIARVTREFDFRPRQLLDCLPDLLAAKADASL